MAKLTKEQWLAARRRWEEDARGGFGWLAGELGGVVSRPAISKMAKSQGWQKVTQKVAQKSTQKVTEKPEKVTQRYLPVRPKKVALVDDGRNAVRRPEGGRPVSYNEHYNELVFNYCLLGAKDKEIAGLLEISEDTLNEWKRSYPRFSESLKEGKRYANAKVSRSLYERALGYSHVETKVFYQDGEIITHDVIKHHPPDVGAAKMFLYNREPELWKDKKEVVSKHGLDQDMIDSIKAQFEARLEQARQRQLEVLRERGID